MVQLYLVIRADGGLKSTSLRQLFELNQRRATPVQATCGLQVPGRRRTRDRRRREAAASRRHLARQNNCPNEQGAQRLSHNLRYKGGAALSARGEALAVFQAPIRFV